MPSFWLLVGVALLASSSHQSRDSGVALSFPAEYDTDAEYDDGLEDFYSNSDEKIWLPHNADDSYDYNVDNDREPSTFVSEEDYLELPDWMNIDFNKLPLDKLELLNNASDLTDLAAFFDLDQENADKLSEQPQSNGTQTESRSAGIVEKNYENPVFARCEPERVKVVLNATKNTGYLPSCVRLMRCGGCCYNEELSCQPTKSEVISLRVMKLTNHRSSRSRRTRSIRNKRSSSSRSRSRRGNLGMMASIQEENHLECSCQCKVQERHCDASVQSYNGDACSCYCKDKVEENKCLQNSSLQTWDSKTCTCACRTVKPCGSAEIFSQENCQCMPIF